MGNRQDSKCVARCAIDDREREALQWKAATAMVEALADIREIA